MKHVTLTGCILLTACGQAPSLPTTPTVNSTPPSSTSTIVSPTGYKSVGMGATIDASATTPIEYNTAFSIPGSLPTQSICTADGSQAQLIFGDVVCTYIPKAGSLYFRFHSCNTGQMPGNTVVVPAGDSVDLKVIVGGYHVSVSMTGVY